jgi:hypothetical protein
MYKSSHRCFQVPKLWVRVRELKYGGKDRAGRKGREGKW